MLAATSLIIRGPHLTGWGGAGVGRGNAAWMPRADVVARCHFFAFELIQALCYPNPTDYQMSIVRIPSSDQHLPPAAAIVTICSGSSYDELYTTRPQISPDASRCIAVYRTDYESLPAILSALQQPGSRDCDSEVLRNLVADISAVSAESPDCVLFNF